MIKTITQVKEMGLSNYKLNELELLDDVNEVKARLIHALKAFNKRGYIIDESKLEVKAYFDQDGDVCYILARNDNDENIINSYISKFYQVTYNTGQECSDKTFLLGKIMKQVSPYLKIKSSTLWSFMIALNPFGDVLQISSEFWYAIMKLAMGEVFYK